MFIKYITTWSNFSELACVPCVQDHNKYIIHMYPTPALQCDNISNCCNFFQNYLRISHWQQKPTILNVSFWTTNNSTNSDQEQQGKNSVSKNVHYLFHVFKANRMIYLSTNTFSLSQCIHNQKHTFSHRIIYTVLT